MRISPHRLTLLVAACGPAAIALAPSAQAGSEGPDCHDAAAVSLCHKPTRGPSPSGGPDPEMQQVLGGNLINPTPPLAAIG